ncbi:MAG TPA: MlaD family protein, partial [Candidatus Obscuribacterales bacterium]
PVNVNGVRVGVVEKIQLKGKGQVLCTLRIKSDDLVIPMGSKFTIQTLGLVGAKYVEITLPDLPAGQAPQPIAQDQIVEGIDPTRVELYLNKIATNLTDFSDQLASEKAKTSIREALETAGGTVKKIDAAAEKLEKNMDKLASASSSFEKGATSASSFFSRGTATMSSVESLTSDLRVTSKRINKLLDNPNFSKDMKETVDMAKKTADSIQVAIHDLHTTLGDQNVRTDLMTMMNRLTAATENIASSMKIAQKIAGDQGLRSDLRQATADAKAAVTKVNEIVNQPGFTSDLKQTMTKVKSAAADVDIAAKQLQQVLNKRSPLLHMMFGRPGRIKEKVQVETEKAPASETTTTPTAAPLTSPMTDPATTSPEAEP